MSANLKRNLLLLLAAALICAIPAFTLAGHEFEGTDDQAAGMIEELDPTYQPWAEPLWEPEELEDVLFGLQAAIGAAVLAGGLLYLRRRRAK